MSYSILDIIAVLCFISCWVGYARFARQKAKTTNCIAKCLHQHRIYWMYQLLKRDIRVSDAALLANLERNITFFASTTMIVLAGVLTLFAQVERLEAVIASIPLAASPAHLLIQLKLGLLTFIFVMAFFQFTWSMRQYGFLNVMIGATPVEMHGIDEQLMDYAEQMAKIQDQAAHSYNYGLRSYYFSMAALCWFFHPLLLILASVVVVYTLFIREFKSKAVMAITAGMQILDERKQQNNI